MTVTIRDERTLEEKDYEELYELYTEPHRINLTVLTKSGKKRHYTFSKKDYEIKYIG